ASASVKILEELNMTDLVTRHPSSVIRHPSSVIGHRSSVTFLNIGTGVDQTVQELAMSIKKIIGFGGNLVFDPAKPDGTYKKLLDISRLKSLGFTPYYTLEKGIEQVYREYVQEKNKI
ncbi:MAG: hypothetical protein V2B15_06245, partial [Bacteroidota bacterium]